MKNNNFDISANLCTIQSLGVVCIRPQHSTRALPLHCSANCRARSRQCAPRFPNMGMDRPAYFFVIIINSLLANFLRRRSPTEQLQTTTSPWLPCLPHEKHLYIIKMFCFGCTNSQIQFYKVFFTTDNERYMNVGRQIHIRKNNLYMEVVARNARGLILREEVSLPDS